MVKIIFLAMSVIMCLINGVNAQIVDQAHILGKGKLYNELYLYISKNEMNIVGDIGIDYVSLIDSNKIDTSGIFLFSLSKEPSSGEYLFYKNKNSARIHIIKKYNLNKLYKIAFKFFRKNNISEKNQVKFLYSLARFYDDYVYIHSPRKYRY